MLNRALREIYPPGSTFKVVTAAAALENGLVHGRRREDGLAGSPYTLPERPRPKLKNDANIPCENATLRVALQFSCNTVFGKIGADLGTRQDAARQAEKFGFNDQQLTSRSAPAPQRLPRERWTSRRPPCPPSASSTTATTPLQMAMVAAAIANDGKLMKPYMVDELQAPNLDVIEQTEPEEMSQPLSSEERRRSSSQMMETVVEDGTGKNAQITGVTVGGKTGTAQHGEGRQPVRLVHLLRPRRGPDRSRSRSSSRTAARSVRSR